MTMVIFPQRRTCWYSPGHLCCWCLSNEWYFPLSCRWQVTSAGSLPAQPRWPAICCAVVRAVVAAVGSVGALWGWGSTHTTPTPAGGSNAVSAAAGHAPAVSPGSATVLPCLGQSAGTRVPLPQRGAPSSRYHAPQLPRLDTLAAVPQLTNKLLQLCFFSWPPEQCHTTRDRGITPWNPNNWRSLITLTSSLISVVNSSKDCGDKTIHEIV